MEGLAAAFGLDEVQAAALGRYVDLLLGWRRGNLTALRDRARIIDTLLGDALALLDVPQLAVPSGPTPPRWLDLGTGAGIPGIPLAVARPEAELTLLEASVRKCAFLEEAVVAAGLEGRVRVVHERSEEHGAPCAAGREAYDIVLARAVAALPVLVELAAPLIRTGGALLPSKTASAIRDEARAALAAAERCGLDASSVVPLPRSPLGGAVCAVYVKTAATPDTLPRRPGMAVKRPFG